jgi:hypothetical protein
MTDIKNWTYDETVREAAAAYIKENDITQGAFTTSLGRGFSITRVAKYLNLNASKTPEPDMPKVEVAIRQFLRHMGRGKLFKANLYDNSISEEVVSVLKQIRRTGDIGIIHGNAGKGKSCGAAIYCQENPNSLLTITRKPYACSDLALMSMLLKEYLNGSTERYDGSGIGLWLEDRLRGSERIWIIDDAELLYMSAVKMAISLHDATGVAICFIGNTEFVEKLSRADESGKLISRIGIVHEVKGGNDEEATAKKLIKQFAPESGDELVSQVAQTLGTFGHGRRARKQLTLAANLYAGASEKDWELAYEAAGTKLVDSSFGKTRRH